MRIDDWTKRFTEEAVKGNEAARYIGMALCAVERRDEELLKRLWNRIERGGSLPTSSQERTI